MTNYIAQSTFTLLLSLLSLTFTSIDRKSETNYVAVTIYSGKCTQYKLTFVPPNKKKFTTVKVAYGKVIVDPGSKKLNFFFDGKLVGGWSNILSYVDSEQGGESFTMSNGWSGYRFTAERLFQMYYSSNTGNDMGYQYDIENYKTN